VIDYASFFVAFLAATLALGSALAFTSFFSTAFPLLPVIGWELGVRLVPYESISGYLKKLEYVYPFITNINTTASALVERGPRKSAHLFIMSGAKGPLCEVKTEL
jgi:hypothetical protein